MAGRYGPSLLDLMDASDPRAATHYRNAAVKSRGIQMRDLDECIGKVICSVVEHEDRLGIGFSDGTIWMTGISTYADCGCNESHGQFESIKPTDDEMCELNCITERERRERQEQKAAKCEELKRERDRKTLESAEAYVRELRARVKGENP